MSGMGKKTEGKPGWVQLCDVTVALDKCRSMAGADVVHQPKLLVKTAQKRGGRPYTACGLHHRAVQLQGEVGDPLRKICVFLTQKLGGALPHRVLDGCGNMQGLIPLARDIG